MKSQHFGIRNGWIQFFLLDLWKKKPVKSIHNGISCYFLLSLFILLPFLYFYYCFSWLFWRNVWLRSVSNCWNDANCQYQFIFLLFFFVCVCCYCINYDKPFSSLPFAILLLLFVILFVFLKLNQIFLIFG